jgi:GTPase SAR1 family protein
VAWQLQTLNLRNNRDLRDLVPSEILETTDAQAILAAYRRYRAADEQKTLRPLNEAKLLVVGNEAVGKTSLLRYLINGKPRDPNEKKTPGIATHEKIETHTWLPKSNSKRCEISLNVWDFGGQEMMRGTHRFFLTERSLYLLVLEDRRQDDESSAENWLKTAVNCGGLSPIIVVINKSDSGKEDLRLNQARLHRNYPNIVGFLRTSCESDDWAAKSIETLRELIATTIAEHSQLKHVRDPFPESYLRVKKAITELASKNSVLSHSQFERICEGGGVARDDEAITDPDEQRALLRLLHDLGTVVAQGLERNAPAAVREITLLDPNWLTGAVYRLLNEPMVRDQEGEFKRDQLNLWLDPKLYPPERHEFILTMMQDPDIGLCFRLPDAGGECYLIPEALRASEPDYDNWPTNSLHFRYIYQYLPSSLIPRFIVQAHRHLTGKKTRWRTGVVLSVRNCRVLIRGDLNGRRIDISVDGPDGLRRSALNVVLDDLEVVHELNPECAAEARVPLPDQPEKDVGYNHLLTLEEEEGSEYRHRPDGAGRAYTVQELLHGVRRNQTRLEPAKRSEPSEFAKHPSPQTNSVKTHVVILVHGIRTQALWQGPIRSSLEKEGFIAEPTNYGRFDLIRFLLPFPWARKAAVEKVTRQIRDIRKQYPGAEFSIISHSFGTFIVAEILREGFDLTFHKLIFCGSVVNYDFPFEQFAERFEAPILNEVGTCDSWPALAQSVTWGYGATGTYAFLRTRVHDRWHKEATHSTFLKPEFSRKYWVPFLKNGEIVSSNENPSSPPWWLKILSVLQIKYIASISLIIWLLYLYWWQ